MSERFETYLLGSLASSGACVIDPQVAYFLRPDLWTSPTHAWGDFRQGADLDRLLIGLRGVLRFRGDVTIEGVTTREAAIVAWSPDRIVERLGWLGLRVDNLVEVRSFTKPKAAPESAVVADLPPPQQCLARERWFEARGVKDPDKVARGL